MMCLKDLLLYTLLLPVPFSVLFLTSSPSSPFVSRPHPSLPIDTTLPLTSPVQERNWLSSNLGRWADPGLIGYRYIAGIGEQEYIATKALRDRIDVLDKANGDWKELGSGESSDTGTAGSAWSDESVTQVEAPQPPQAAAPSPRGGGSWGLSRIFRLRDGRERNESDGGAVVRSVDSADSASAVPTTTQPSEPQSSPPSQPTSNPASSFNITSSTPLEIPAYIKTTPLDPLPPGYLDLRWRGIGVILDLSPRRTESGVAWEIAQVLDASETRVEAKKAELERKEQLDKKRQERERRMGLEREKEKRRKEKEAEAGGGEFWGRVGVVGHW